MKSKRGRLDRFISRTLQINRKHVRKMLAEGRVIVDGETARDIALPIDEFTTVQCDGKLLQQNTPIYILLNKPIGVVSATKDDQHKTVIDLLEHPQKNELHIVGRLDLNTSGLLLLTNDSRWSSKLMLPENKVEKHYLVTLEKPISNEYIEAFAGGMHFEFEDIITKPVKLEIMNDFQAKVILTEGRYHQIKRMFGRFRNPVIGLHRYRIGGLELDTRIDVGESRLLNQDEVNSI
ncbi:MAG: pseudouridine synthase [Parashewanella sp.]